MNPLNSQWFYRGLKQKLKEQLPTEKAEKIWQEAGKEYAEILSLDAELKKHKGAMVLPAVVLYRVLEKNGEDAEKILNAYGDHMGEKFAGIVHGITSLPGVSRLLWKHMDSMMDRMSSEKLGYQRELVSGADGMLGVDILSCPYHELAKQLGNEKAVRCICHMDKRYSQGFHAIRYERNSSVGKGDKTCAYRLRFDHSKK